MWTTRVAPRLSSLVLLALLGSTATGLGADTPAEALLKDRGLKKAGTAYVLPGEAEAQKILAEMKGIAGRLTQAQAMGQAQTRAAAESKEMIRQLTEQRIYLNRQLAQANNPRDHNQMAAMVNGVTDQLNLLRAQEVDPDATRAPDAQAGRFREAYIGRVLDLRRSIDATTKAYADLAADPAIKEAVASAGAGKATLGPSKAFAAAIKSLERAESMVLTESVPLRKEGGIYWVDVTFNGTTTKSMAFDTGAADVVLPADFAAKVGLVPGPDAPVVKCRVADGSIVEARSMIVPSMRVGKFTVKDVPCTIMPGSKANVPPLLGQTFQRNFLIRLNPDAGQLTLSQVDSPDAPRPTPPAPKPGRITTKGRNP